MAPEKDHRADQHHDPDAEQHRQRVAAGLRRPGLGERRLAGIASEGVALGNVARVGGGRLGPGNGRSGTGEARWGQFDRS